jgi:hypothetical protein
MAVGCAGGRMLNHMLGRIKAAYLAINTDRRKLGACRVEFPRNLPSLRLTARRIDIGSGGDEAAYSLRRESMLASTTKT